MFAPAAGTEIPPLNLGGAHFTVPWTSLYPFRVQDQPFQPSGHLFYKKNLAPLQAVKGEMK